MGQHHAKLDKEKLNRTRNEIAREIVTTEESYVQSLDLAINVFFEPLLHSLSNDRSPILSESEVTAIFSTIKDIFALHSSFLSKLNERYSDWTEKTKLADIFLAQVDSFKVYTSYVNNYDLSIKTLVECQKRKKVIRFLEGVHREHAVLGLSNYLIMPIQRLPRYVLLLQELLKKTTKQHRDYKNLKKAVKEMKQVTAYINEQKRMAEVKQQMLDLQSHFAEPLDFFSNDQRLLITEGQFECKESNASNLLIVPVVLAFFLFTDVLVLAQERQSSSSFFLSFFQAPFSWQLIAYAPITNVELNLYDLNQGAILTLKSKESNNKEVNTTFIINVKDNNVQSALQELKYDILPLLQKKAKKNNYHFVDIIPQNETIQKTKLVKDDSKIGKQKEKTNLIRRYTLKL
ncbi:putative Cell division control protein CDC24 [Balamuthia mandrillaris]